MTAADFFQLYIEGQRFFADIDLDYQEGFSNKEIVNVIFDHCYLAVDFSNSDLTNTKFISSNLKEINLSNADLTNALIENCSVEMALFKGAIITGLRFFNNGYYGSNLGQSDLEEIIRDQEKS